MDAIILSAGAGSRLLPLTQTMPKCLIEVDGRGIIDHQLDALHAAGVRNAVIAVGYREAQIAQHFLDRPPPIAVTTVFNPFWSVASSIGSVWAVRDHLVRPFCLMNGDTIFDAPVLADAIGSGRSGVGLLVESCAAPELDDMRVEVADGRVMAVGKDLPTGSMTHRSLGVVLSFTADDAYLRALRDVIAAPDGLHAYHHAVVARLAATSGVAAIVNHAGAWQEIDRPEDIPGWTRAHQRAAPQ